VRKVLVSTVAYALFGGVIAGLVVVLGVDRTDYVLDAYLVFVGALIALAAARIARGAFPGPRGTVPAVVSRSPRRYVHPESLATMEDDVALAQADVFDVHFRLRPILREIAAAGLATQSGIELDREPERALERLSPVTWELVRPDRPRPVRPEGGGAGGKGIDTPSLDEIVTELERILPR
jgi:hypothetical protein